MARHNRGVEHRAEHRAGGDRINRDRAERGDRRAEGRHRVDETRADEQYRPEATRRGGDAGRASE